MSYPLDIICWIGLDIYLKFCAEVEMRLGCLSLSWCASIFEMRGWDKADIAVDTLTAGREPEHSCPCTNETIMQSAFSVFSCNKKLYFPVHLYGLV